MSGSTPYKNPIIGQLAEEGIFSVSTEYALEVLGVSISTLSDYKKCLNVQRPVGWDYIPKQTGFTLGQLDCLLVLQQLVSDLGRAQAQRQINQVARYRQQMADN